MKFAFSFFVLASLVVWIADPMSPNWKWILFWPAANLYVASIFYAANNPRCFGKGEDGTLKILILLLFFPYLMALWCVWLVSARICKENRFDSIRSNLWIGRRLDQSEAKQTDFDNIIDLTAEFNEPAAFRGRNYLPFFMLDGAVPAMDQLQRLSQKACQLPGKTYVHCAQGHGRTGLVALAILLELEPNLSVEEALKQLKACRAGIHCNKRQMRYLNEYARQRRQDG